jgi:thymidine kinase
MTDNIINDIKDCIENTNPLKKSGIYNYNLQTGKLELFCGPMFSGKTTLLTNTLTKMSDLELSVLYVNHISDVRDTESVHNYITSHNSQFKGVSSKVDVIRTDKLEKIDVAAYDVIGIDEGQFFSDIYEMVTKWVNEHHKYVMVGFLDGDWGRQPFMNVLGLYAHADTCTKLTSECKICLRTTRMLVPAPFTARLSNDKETIVIGGKDKYMAMCRFHYDEHNKNL